LFSLAKVEVNRYCLGKIPAASFLKISPHMKSLALRRRTRGIHLNAFTLFLALESFMLLAVKNFTKALFLALLFAGGFALWEDHFDLLFNQRDLRNKIKDYNLSPPNVETTTFMQAYLPVVISVHFPEIRNL
jgi:hypothetical protein